MFSKTTSRYASLESAASHDTRGISTAPVEATRSKRPRVSTGRVSAPPPVAADTAPSAGRGAARAPDGRATVTSCNRCSAAPIDVICEMGASPRPARCRVWAPDCGADGRGSPTGRSGGRERLTANGDVWHRRDVQGVPELPRLFS